MAELMSAMISLLIWHYLQTIVVLIGLGFAGLILVEIEEGDYWAALGSVGAAAGILWIAGQM
jgi:hypothetical protein